MADTLTISTLRCELSGKVVTDTPLVPLSVQLRVALSFGLADGTAAGMADKVYVARRVLDAAATENLDLAGTLIDPLGQTVTFVRIKAMVFVVQPVTAAVGLEVGGAATNVFANWIASAGVIGTDQPRVKIRNGPAGGWFGITAGDATGWPVTAGTGDSLKVTNLDATLAITYDVAIAGASA